LPREIPSICAYCAEGCGFSSLVEQGKIASIEYMKDHPVNKGGLCLKGNAALDVITHPDRILSPLLKEEGNTFQETSWDEAVNTIAANFKKIAKKHGPDSLAFLTSAHCTNEEIYLFQKLARVLGTNNIDCPSFHEGNLNIVDLATSLGHASTTNPLSDLANSKCIIISGSNFLENHPIAAYWVFEAKARGATIIYIDHRLPPSLLICDHFLQISPGTHSMLIEGMITHILEKNLFNQQFISEHTSGFETYKKDARKQSLKFTEKISGIPAAKIKEVAEIYASSSESSIINCNDFSSQYDNHNCITTNLSNLALLCGHLGREGTGIIPLLEHNNTQGSYDMGASPSMLPGQITIKDESQNKKIAKDWKVNKLPSKGGLSFPEMIKAIKRKKIKALYIMESSPLEDNVYGDQLKHALKGLEFLLVQDLFLTETAQQADIVLPVNCWAEKSGSYTNTERRVQWQSRIINPLNKIIPNWQVMCSVAKKLGLKKQFTFNNPEAILKEINKVIPAYTGISANRVSRTDGLIMPCPTPKHSGTPILYTEHFNTPDGLGKFNTAFYTKKLEKTTQRFPYFLTFGKTPTFHNNVTVSKETSPSTPASAELFVEINSKDAKKIHIQDQSEVKISTKAGSIKATACITEKVLPGVVFVPFLLLSDSGRTSCSLDPRAKFPELNETICQIKGSGGNKGEQ
jgi:predicted molibdopterin-dependent oxidoreductase YjgC